MNHSNQALTVIRTKDERSARIIAHPASLRHLQRSRVNATLAIPLANGHRYVRFDQIVRCQADGNYANIHLQTEEVILVSKTLKWVADQLHSHRFFRIHASHLVHKDCITLIDGHQVELDSGETLPIARSRRAALVAFMQSATASDHI